MRILALVTARGGSKRLPGKNVRALGGKPLIAWTIAVARDVPQICEVLVSTDDPAIADAARAAGGSVPWLRPPELATDTASSVDVAIHALDCFESQSGPVDGLLLLQPTSPFRTRDSLCRGIALFEADPSRPVVGVSPAVNHPMWTFREDGGALVPFVQGGGVDARSQDLPPAYVLNGAFYLIAPAQLRASHSFVAARPAPLIFESAREALDIDTESDWGCAERALAGPPSRGRCPSED